MGLRVFYRSNHHTSIQCRRDEHLAIASLGRTLKPKHVSGIFEGETKAFVLAFDPPLGCGKVATQNSNT
jgi:hypothetical protein